VTPTTIISDNHSNGSGNTSNIDDCKAAGTTNKKGNNDISNTNDNSDNDNTIDDKDNTNDNDDNSKSDENGGYTNSDASDNVNINANNIIDNNAETYP
jgi:hypothetical protein